MLTPTRNEGKVEYIERVRRIMNGVEVDNSISSLTSCAAPLKVVTLRARNQGRLWLHAAQFIGDADVVILNEEMDIGMARTDNQHMTRLMAQRLGMNYAWGLEFVQLAQKRDDRAIPNFNGLRGRAFLAKCAISNPLLLRNKSETGIGDVVGGHTTLLGTIDVDEEETVIGSVGALQAIQMKVKKYIGGRKSAIAGNHSAEDCHVIGLQSGAGNMICTNMRGVGELTTALTGAKQFGFSVQMGVTSVNLAVH